MRSPVVIAIRKPWGEGRAAMQKQKRQSNPTLIASRLLDRLDVDNIQLTGQLMPRGTLKKRSIRALFTWVHEFPGRVFTYPLLKMVVRKLLRSIGDVPRNPKQSYGGYVASQAKRLGILAHRAKRIKNKEGSQGFWWVFEFKWVFFHMRFSFELLAQIPLKEEKLNQDWACFCSTHSLFLCCPSPLQDMSAMDNLETQMEARSPLICQCQFSSSKYIG